MKKISERTLAEINQLKPEELCSHGVLTLVRGKSDEYICPNVDCANGSGSDATGIKFKDFGSHVGGKCHRCGENFNPLKICAAAYGLSAQRDFQALVEKICADFGIALIYDDDTPIQWTKKPPAQVAKPTIAPVELEFIHADLAAEDEPLKKFCADNGGAWRGLPADFLLQFGCKFIQNWTSPKSRAAKKSSTSTPRLLIPNSKDDYIARLTCSLDEFDETAREFIKPKQHAGTKTLFNPDALKNPVVVVVEGAPDALSIEFAGFHAVATGGADSYKLLVDAVAKMKDKPLIVILFDSDATGRKYAPILQTALIKLGCAASVQFLSDEESKLDANEILTTQGLVALRGTLADIIDSAREDFNGFDFLQGDKFDLANARRLEKFRGKFFRWLTDEEQWLTYKNGIWLRRSEKSSVLYPFAVEFADQMLNFTKILGEGVKEAAQAVAVKNGDGSIQRVDEQAKKKYEIAKARADKADTITNYFQKRKNYSAAIELLKGCDSILINSDDLNAHKNLLCCADCVVDLQTGKIYNFAPDFLFTNQTTAAYQKFIDAEATAFVEKVLADILPDEETRRAVLRYLGYALTGERNYQVSQFWRGSGANGKSTILDTLFLILGSYVVKLPCAALLASSKPADGNAATPAIALLDGDKRLALVDELPQKSRLDAALYKSLVTDKTVTGRLLHCNFRDIQLRCKFILNGNFFPIFNANDNATRRRINAVEFMQVFEGERADKNLLNKLADPRAQTALLRILVSEALLFYREGLLESTAMKQAKLDYVHESDFVSEFVGDNCETGNGSILRKDFEAKLKAEYPAETSQFSKSQLLKAICDSLKPLGVEYSKDRHNKNIFKGIRWQHADYFDGEPISPDD